MSNLAKLTDEELIARQQEIMLKRGEAERKFKEQAQEVQFEIDKRAFKARMGGAPTAAELAALDELREEAKQRDAAESEDES